MEMPTTRAKNTTILGAISPFRITNIKASRPNETPLKKRKLPGASKGSTSKTVKTTGNVTGHYFNFIAYS